jgi:maleate isomerase
VLGGAVGATSSGSERPHVRSASASIRIGQNRQPVTVVARSRDLLDEMSIRRRIALIVPATNSTAEPDFGMAVPDGVTVHSHRLWVDGNVAKASTMDGMNSHLVDAAKHLALLNPDVICMAGTTNSFYRGLAGSLSMEERMRLAGRAPAVSSSPSVVQALQAYGAYRISVATPYMEWNNDRLREYLSAAGFDVLNVEGDARIADGHPQRMNDQDPSDIAEFAVATCRPQADAIFCSCSGWRAMEAAAEVEARTGKLVVTTNQATIWRTLRTLGLETARDGFGRLLDEMPALSMS